MNKKLKPELIYYLTSIIMGCVLIWRSLLSLEEVENRRLLFEFCWDCVVSEYVPGLSCTGNSGQQLSGQRFLLDKIFGSIPVAAYFEKAEKEKTLVENQDIYDWIRFQEGTDEKGQATEEKEAEEEPVVADREVEEPMENPSINKITDDIQLEKLEDFDYLLSRFYSVDRTTTIGPEQLDAKKLLAADMRLTGDNSSPQILIYHTHSTEGYLDSVSGNRDMTVTGLGETLAEELRAYGYQVIHDTTAFDAQNRDYAYSNAEPVIAEILKENPTIEVVIDLHRDGVAEKTHLVTSVDGRQTAQFMFFNGLSRTTAQGDIAYLNNPYIQDNLAFSLQLQMAAAKLYPGITRKIYLKGYRYNMHLRPKSLLVEVGAQTNTVEESRNAIKPLADVLHIVLSGTIW